MPVRRTFACIVVLACSVPATAAARAPWATVNVCNTPSNPDTVGIRGSMPGFAGAAEMFMRFQLQYERRDGSWRFVGDDADSGFVDVGRSRIRGSRQAGHSFQVAPPPAGTVYTFRGVVTFEWRAKDGTVVRSARRRTTPGHRATVGSDPPGFSAGECLIVG